MNFTCPQVKPATFEETLQEVETVQFTEHIVESRDRLPDV